MNIVIVSHERSLNKTEGLLKAFQGENVFLVCEYAPNENKTYTQLATEIILSKTFDVTEIIRKIPHADQVFCVSENLLPVQSQLESFYGIENLSAFAAEILSNKQNLDNFCRQIGLEKYTPKSITPTSYKQLGIFNNSEIFSKPDIGTGSNVFYPGDDQSTPSIEYRRWNHRHHFLKYISKKKMHNEFFDLNSQGIYTKRFNYKPCRIMFQEYHWSQEPSASPIGYVRDGKVNINFYVKNSKVKYGEQIDPLSNPIESHSVSEISDIVRERAVWIAMPDEVSSEIAHASTEYMQTLVDALKIKNMFFSGPDFHICKDGKIIAIDLNPRPGQFVNILDSLNDENIIRDFLSGGPVTIKNKLLWGCAVLQPGKVRSLKNIETVSQYFNAQNTVLEPSTVIPEFQNLQNKAFNFNLDISGTNEQELFDNYIRINQQLQDCIEYEKE